jgi:hypothetical protein
MVCHLQSQGVEKMKHWLAKPLVHPLRKSLTQEDWVRIQAAMKSDDVDAVTDEEIDAAHDVLYDAVAGKMQTHEGLLVLH